MGFQAYLDEIKKKHVYFYYHYNFHYIPDNAGDIKLESFKSNQNTGFTYYYFDIMSIRWQSTGFEAYFDEIKKKHAYFHYHLNCHYITDNAGDIKV